MKPIKNTITFVILLLFSIAGYSQSSFVISHGANRSITIEFKEENKSGDIILGVGVSYFYNKGNKGKDYTGFVTNNAISYQQVIAKEGALFFVIGNKINKKLLANFRFGVGNVVRYVNGSGLPGMPNELWYTRNKFGLDILCGFSVQYNTEVFSYIAGWDNFNSFNIGVGINFNQQK